MKDVSQMADAYFPNKLHWHTCAGCNDSLPCWCDSPSLTPLDLHAMRRGEKPKEEKPTYCLECRPFDRRKME